MKEKAQAPRILAGLFRGRKLRVPAGRVTRPARALVRRSIFDILNVAVRDSAWLDLYAGSGSIGIEALSRGARCAAFVESGRQGITALTANLQTLALEPPTALILRRRLPQTLLGLPPALAPFNFVSMDPPFAVSRDAGQLKDLVQGLAQATASGWFASEARIIWEEPDDAPAPAIPGFTEVDRRPHGVSRVRYFILN